MTALVDQRPQLTPLTVPGGERSVAQRWKAVVAAYPDRTALVSDGAHYSFAEADRRSDRLAALLLPRLPAGDDPIALAMGHDADTVVAMLAVIKTGRPLVLLDAHMPAERLRVIAGLARATTVLTDPARAELAATLGDPVQLVVDTAELLATSGTVSSPPLPDRDYADPVAIIFTSGSTGLPKGVVNTNGQSLNDGLFLHVALELTSDDRMALVFPLSFLAGYATAIGALMSGAALHCFDPRESGLGGFARWLIDERITVLSCTPHLLRSATSALEPGQRLDSLRVVCTAGEAIHGRDVAAVRPFLSPHATYVNMTGSSEIGSLSYFAIRAGDEIPNGSVPAGIAAPNKRFHVVLDDGTVAPDGTAGHLVVISEFLSAGYMTSAELTAEKFGVNEQGERFHLQGDLARVDDGVLMLLGRDDAAVKVRGYFVEPAEIEAAILDSPAVRETVVLAVLSDEAPTYLVAYVVPDPRAATESVAALRRRLRERLPEYMVPAVIVPMTALPRNERGKVERRSLPAAPERASGEPPATQWEKVVADLWGEVLGLDEIHLDDDFMALGADSLTAEEMLAQAGDRFSVSLVTSDLLEAPTLREFSHRVSLGSASLPSHPDVVSLGGRGTATPVFCFAGGGALALGFAPIARHFGDRPVYAFQSHGLERRALPDRTVEAAADRALALMRVIQPSGPYLVVGHSFGGLVALEVARRLTDAGQEVALVGLLDTFLLTGLTAQDASAAAQVAQGAMVPQRLDTPPGRLSGGIQVLDGLLRRVLPDGVPQLPEWGRHARSKVAGVVTFAGQRQFDAHFDHTVKVARRHQPKPYDGAVLLITAENNPQGAETWAPVLTGPLEVRDMPCEHSSMIREPHAAQVAAHLAEQIDALGL